MNKKILLFLVVAIAGLSIMAVSIWGTLAESQSLPSVATLEITGYDDINDFGDKIIFVKDIITKENYMYTIHYVVTPGDANVDGIKAMVDVEDGIEVFPSIADMAAVVVFGIDKIGQAVTVTIWDSKSMKTDSVTLLFSNESEVIIEEPVFD